LAHEGYAALTRIVATALLTLAATVPALPADRVVTLTLDGRPFQNPQRVAVARDGIVYANLTALVKAFNGLMSYRNPGMTVTINGTTAIVTPGSRTMKVMDGSVVLPGDVFRRNGDLYVPLDAFVRRVARGTVRHPSSTSAEIVFDADPLS
jgi:hypothetical protein